jgi:hypothetical protein
MFFLSRVAIAWRASWHQLRDGRASGADFCLGVAARAAAEPEPVHQSLVQRDEGWPQVLTVQQGVGETRQQSCGLHCCKNEKRHRCRTGSAWKMVR